MEPVAVVDGGNGNRVHMDGFRGYDIGRQGAGGVDGCGEHEHDRLNLSGYNGGSGVSW